LTRTQVAADGIRDYSGLRSHPRDQGLAAARRHDCGCAPRRRHTRPADQVPRRKWGGI